MRIKHTLRKAFAAAILSAAAVTAATAAPRCADGRTAMAQLLAAAPGGVAALDAIKVAVPESSPQTRGKAVNAVLLLDASDADLFISGEILSAEKKGDLPSARLFQKLLAEGSPEEKNQLLKTATPYAFPARFYAVSASGSVCQWVTETFCTVSCWGTGAERDCREACRDVIVKSCD